MKIEIRLYCTILYHTILYNTVPYCTILYCTVLYCTILYCTVPADLPEEGMVWYPDPHQARVRVKVGVELLRPREHQCHLGAVIMIHLHYIFKDLYCTVLYCTWPGRRSSMRLLDTVTRAQLYTSAMSATQIAMGFVWLLP